MNYFIKNIKINKLFHLQDFQIPIANEQAPHLIITGKNGSGKTVLLNAIASFLDKVKDDVRLSFLDSRKWLKYYQERRERASSDKDLMQADKDIEFYHTEVEQLFGKVELEFNDVASIIKEYQQADFIITFYQADRKSRMDEPRDPKKPKYAFKANVWQTATDQFLNFLSDLKIQEALARNEQQLDDADHIRQWFIDFENLLKQIYQDENLKLKFNYRDYSFRICTGDKQFKFTETSDGFAAVLDIVADLILKMQSQEGLVRTYQKQGIVLIDEIETHLHLELQRIIMPILTQIFPNIQFIVTTHSPFVLSSMKNAVAFDLEHREVIEELTEYSYEALAEGYFGVRTESSYMEMQLDTLRSLLEKEELNDADRHNIRLLIEDFEKIPESVSPRIVGSYLQLKNRYSSIFKEILA